MSLHSDRLVYVRVPKTGSAYVYDVLLTQEGAKGFGEPQHSSLAHLVETHPEKVEGRTTFGMVRNPWSWYVSMYVHATLAADEEPTKRGFREFLYDATHAKGFSQPEGILGFGVIWNCEDVDKDITVDGGLYTHVTTGVLGDLVNWTTPVVDRILFTDRLAEGLNVLLDQPLQTQFMQPRNVRQAPFLPDTELYTREMISWVGAADKTLIEMFEFAPFEPSKGSVFQPEPPPPAPEVVVEEPEPEIEVTE